MEPPPAPPDDAPITPPKAKGKILQWFNRNPLVAPVTFAIGILSFVATLYFGFAGFKSRELSLYVNPSKTTIVKSGQSSDLHILYKGKDVSTDVTALQVELWNAGKESIRPEHVLSPIFLETTPRVPILEARIRHTSRSVTEIVLDQTHIADGKVTVSWKILEHNDGAVIQFILAAPTETSIRALGAMEGQPRVNILGAQNNAKASSITLAFGVTMLMIFATSMIILSNHPRASARLKFALRLALVVSPLIFIAVDYYLLAEPSIPIQFN
jgi:hypothetical protein